MDYTKKAETLRQLIDGETNPYEAIRKIASHAADTTPQSPNANYNLSCYANKYADPTCLIIRLALAEMNARDDNGQTVLDELKEIVRETTCTHSTAEIGDQKAALMKERREREANERK